jgi:hypothetical protein
VWDGSAKCKLTRPEAPESATEITGTHFVHGKSKMGGMIEYRPTMDIIRLSMNIITLSMEIISTS